MLYMTDIKTSQSESDISTTTPLLKLIHKHTKNTVVWLHCNRICNEKM